MCAEYIYDEAIIFKIHKKLLKVNNKKKNLITKDF